MAPPSFTGDPGSLYTNLRNRCTGDIPVAGFGDFFDGVGGSFVLLVRLEKDSGAGDGFAWHLCDVALSRRVSAECYSSWIAAFTLAATSAGIVCIP